MSTVLEIEKAIEALPTKEFWQIAEWMEQKRIEAEEAQDLARAEAILAEGEDFVPWEDVQRRCGLLP